jgi:hypothetical protein
MKNGMPKRYELPKSNAVSGRGRDWFVMFGPPYVRGRFSFAYWKRNSLSRFEVADVTSWPLIAFESFFSIAFALVPQESTSNVPFSYSENV